ncbi:ABC transporter permease [Hyphobacterium sp.]|uniref:ABC transporter permease n=1 Tax=Hyphobacterium sp. TaxID=2004662 RepID=UPI003BA91768
MRAIYLIARREYLSYVATWGFWLSLMSVPFFMAVGFLIPLLAENSQPTRYYAVIDQTGMALDRRLEQELVEGQKDEVLEALRPIAQGAGREDAMPAVEAALRAEPGLEGFPEALQALGVPVEISEAQFASRFVRVEAPGNSIEELQPFLLGEQSITVDGEDHALFAAVLFQRGGDFGVTGEYWSDNRTSTGLRSAARRTLRDFVRTDALEAAGISSEALAEINAMNPRVRELSPERGREDAEVSIEDRIPFVVGIFFSIGLWVMIFSVTNMLLTAMIEEKGNKILETLLATARFHEILVGKLIGVAGVTATFMMVWGGVGTVGLLTAQSVAAAANLPVAGILGAVFDPGLLIPAIAYFVVGYLMFGTMYLAIGSLCDTLQEAQSLMSPMILIMMVPFIIIMVTLENPDSPFLQVASWVPIWTPFLMLSRLQTDPGLFELVGTSVLMIATAVLIIGLASLIFRQGALGRANASSVKKLFSRKKVTT